MIKEKKMIPIGTLLRFPAEARGTCTVANSCAYGIVVGYSGSKLQVRWLSKVLTSRVGSTTYEDTRNPANIKVLHE